MRTVFFLKFEINKVMNFICVLSRVNTVIFNDVTVDIDLSAYEKSSAETMAGKRKQISTPQKEVAISIYQVNQLTPTLHINTYISRGGLR
jgi:hypothetical protein